jgi:hypothetical protein
MAEESKKLHPLLGKKGQAEIVQVFIVKVRDDDTGVGSSFPHFHSMHTTHQAATEAARGSSTWGRDGEIEPGLAVRFGDDTHIYLGERQYTHNPTKEAEQDSAKQSGLAKLTDEEKAALGVPASD